MVSIQAKVTSKGQITLPKQISKRLAIFPGSEKDDMGGQKKGSVQDAMIL